MKKVLLSYGPNGRSRGEATVVFGRPDSAAKAQKEFNNVGVDGKPMRVCTLERISYYTCANAYQIEIVASATASRAPAKALSDRMAYVSTTTLCVASANPFIASRSQSPSPHPRPPQSRKTALVPSRPQTALHEVVVRRRSRVVLVSRSQRQRMSLTRRWRTILAEVRLQMVRLQPATLLFMALFQPLLRTVERWRMWCHESATLVLRPHCESDRLAPGSTSNVLCSPQHWLLSLQ